MESPVSSRQKTHYERIHDDYGDHYYDLQSMAYRRRFVYEPMFEGLDLNGKRVADLACGSGMNSTGLLECFPRAEVEGFDISSKACADYRRIIGRPAHEVDLSRDLRGPARFDVAITDALHHCVSDLNQTLENMASLLVPGGLLIMYEPNADYFLEPARRFWYRHDRYFDAPTERALDHDSVLQLAGRRFKLLDVRYGGGPAYFLVLNSLLFRLPKSVKSLISPSLFALEDVFHALPGRKAFANFIARWERIAT